VRERKKERQRCRRSVNPQRKVEKVHTPSACTNMNEINGQQGQHSVLGPTKQAAKDTCRKLHDHGVSSLSSIYTTKLQLNKTLHEHGPT
jgi:glycerate kinase